MADLCQVLRHEWPVAAPGDSGGPVCTYAADGSVVARGTMSAADLGIADCPGLNSWGADDVWYAPLLRPDGDPEIGTVQDYAATVAPGTTILTC